MSAYAGIDAILCELRRNNESEVLSGEQTPVTRLRTDSSSDVPRPSPGCPQSLFHGGIVPTLTMYRDTSKEFATKYMWWFFLIQKEPLPEHMIGCDPEFFLDKHLEIQNGTPGAITPEAMVEYRRCFCNS